MRRQCIRQRRRILYKFSAEVDMDDKGVPSKVPQSIPIWVDRDAGDESSSVSSESCWGEMDLNGEEDVEWGLSPPPGTVQTPSHTVFHLMSCQRVGPRVTRRHTAVHSRQVLGRCRALDRCGLDGWGKSSTSQGRRSRDGQEPVRSADSRCRRNPGRLLLATHDEHEVGSCVEEARGEVVPSAVLSTVPSCSRAVSPFGVDEQSGHRSAAS